MVNSTERFVIKPPAAKMPEHRSGSKLSSIELYTLFLTARGFRRQDIAGLRGVSEITVRNQKRDIHGKLGVQSTFEAILNCVEKGQFRLEDLTRGLNMGNIGELTPQEHNVLGVMTSNNGINSSYKLIAKNLEISVDTVKNHFYSINYKLQTHNTIRSGLLHLRAQRRP